MKTDSDLQKILPAQEQDYDRSEELKAFDDTKAGVKGLVDTGVVTIPRIFLMPPENILSAKLDDHVDSFQVPVIDLKSINLDPAAHTEVVKKIRNASEKWGFFQVINHGIPQDVMNKVITGVRRFHEQPKEVKMEFYSRENEKKIWDAWKGIALFVTTIRLVLNLTGLWGTPNTVILTFSQFFYKITLEASRFFTKITGLMSLHMMELS
ncbi:hypothetical protein COLO4_15437 [Corchorus olitorius]|uniref:Non-haem dioxygenase N-terminal domain-containing protein n=1 Tax=Corchorus olitorius TaxID=93759 RepID=A0A1R3JNA2_9ROSI|nr:hypothetical protein COLO4_15437 [Corchorus olitorius]